MDKLLTSIFLCLLANAAAAQCVGDAPASAMQARPGAAMIVRTTAAPAGAAPADTAPPRKAGGPELIKTAAAGPRDVPAMRQSAISASRPKTDAAGDEQPRRTGPAMLLAALAVMTAIALRRSGADGQ